MKFAVLPRVLAIRRRSGHTPSGLVKQRCQFACIRCAVSAVAVTAMMLSGCASQTVAISGDPASRVRWEQQRQERAALGQWTMDGRLAISNETQGWTATVHWDQRPERFAMDLKGPFGQGGARLEGARDGATLDLADGTHKSALSAGNLVRDVLGWEIPVEALRYWVVGLPQPGLGAQLDLADTGYLAALTQAGWRIEYLRYREVRGHWMPAGLVARRAPWKVKLVVDQWGLI